MTYRELLELYQQGRLEEKKRKEVEAEIEKQDAISDYLFQADGLWGLDEKNPDILSGRSGPESVSGPDALLPKDVSGPDAPLPEEEPDMEAQFVRMVNRSIRRAFLKMGAIVGTVVLAIVLAVIFILPRAVDLFYYNPGKTVAQTQYGDSTVTTNQMSLDMAVYTELLLPETPRDNVVVDSRGYGDYDIRVIQNFSLNSRFYNVSGKVERGKLTLYDMNALTPMTGNQFDWFQRTRTDLSLTDQDLAEQNSGEWGEGEHAMHGPVERDDMKENLEKLKENEYYLGYVTLNEMMDYKDFLAFYQSQKDLGMGWCAVKTHDTSGTEGYFRTDNAGFRCDLSASTSCGWDKEKYPNLLLWENTEEGYEKAARTLEDEAAVKQHFVSLLRYMSEQKEFCEMMHTNMDFVAAADYVEENGLKIYGFTAVGDKEAWKKLSKRNEVYVIDTKEL